MPYLILKTDMKTLLVVNSEVFCEVARSDDADLEKSLDVAHSAASEWG
jgi:aldehyde dehydrogenase